MPKEVGGAEVTVAAEPLYEIERYGDVEVLWSPAIDGGGKDYGQDYLPLVEGLFGRVGRVLDVCAGAGFIGFALLARGLCNHLTLADVNPDAVRAMEQTVARNGLQDRVDVYLSDALSGLPSSERYDLVVGNPPNWPHDSDQPLDLIRDDPAWQLHRSFYGQVGAHLAPGGSALISECSVGAGTEDFLPLIAAGGLAHVQSFWFCRGSASPVFYYIWTKRSIPGLAVEDGRVEEVTLEIGEEPVSSRRLIAEHVYQATLVNKSDRTLPLTLTDADGEDLRWLGRDIGPGEVLPLPRFALPIGVYQVTDRETAAELLRIVAAGEDEVRE